MDNGVAPTAFGCIPHEMAGSCLNVSIDNEGGLLGFIFTYRVSSNNDIHMVDEHSLL